MDLLDRNNKHIFLENINNKNNSFIANVNKLARKLDLLINLNDLFTEEDIKILKKIYKLDLNEISKDLAKGSLNGFRKLDINLLENFKDYDDNLTDEEKTALWNDPTKQVYYDYITVLFTDNTSLKKEFKQNNEPIVINNHHQLYTQLDEWYEFKFKSPDTRFSIYPDTPIPNHELLRIWDGERGSNVQQVELHVAPKGQNQNYDSVFFGAKEYNPTYTWIDSTSILIIIANRINELLELSGNVEHLVILRKELDKLITIYNNLEKLVGTNTQSLFNNMNKLIELYNHLDIIKNTEFIASAVLEFENKADKIKEIDVSSTYDVVFTVDNKELVNDIAKGDTFVSGMFTLVVTNVDNNTISYRIHPNIVNSDYSSFYLFIGDKGKIEATVKCIPSSNKENKIKNLIDVYNELLYKIDNSSNSISYLINSINTQKENLRELEELVADLDLGMEGATLSNLVFKNSPTTQVLNSDIALGTDKELQGVSNNGYIPLLSIKEVTENSAIKNIINIGADNAHLQLHTNESNNYGNHISVVTKEGIRQVAYIDEITGIAVSEAFIGFCLPYAGDDVPDMCKPAIGNIYKIEDFPIAGEKLGNKYGGDGVTTFGTPNLHTEAPAVTRWMIILGKDKNSSSRLYCGRPNIYCGLEGLYPSKPITDY